MQREERRRDKNAKRREKMKHKTRKREERKRKTRREKRQDKKREEERQEKREDEEERSCDLQRFVITIAGATVNDDGHGGTAPDPLVWNAGSLPKQLRIVEAVRECAMLPGPEALWSGGWQGWPEFSITADDVRAWLFFFRLAHRLRLLRFLVACIGLLRLGTLAVVVSLSLSF